MEDTYLFAELTLQFWSFAFKVAPLPGNTTLIVVVVWSYPVPDSNTFTEVIKPFDSTGTTTAPVPSPSITRSGGELYFLPEFVTNTSWSFPLLIMGCICASVPETRVTDGGLFRFNTSEDPYPTPLFERLTEVTSPRNIGCSCAWKVSCPIEDIPIDPAMVTEISG